MLLRTVGELHDARPNPLAEQLVGHFESERNYGAAIIEHEAVIDAIASRSPEAARAAMASHLASSLDRLTATPLHREHPQRAAACRTRARPAPASHHPEARRTMSLTCRIHGAKDLRLNDHRAATLGLHDSAARACSHTCGARSCGARSCGTDT